MCLFPTFLTRTMGVSLSDSEKPLKELKKKFPQVECPFCGKGNLRLTGVIPRNNCGIHNSDKEAHTSNKYEFKCTGRNCRAKFTGFVCFITIS